jgi:hypothetical protein
MRQRCLCEDFELRGQTYEIWNDSGDRYLADPRKRQVVDTDAFDPPLTNEELLSIYDYGKGF